MKKTEKKSAAKKITKKDLLKIKTAIKAGAEPCMGFTNSL